MQRFKLVKLANVTVVMEMRFTLRDDGSALLCFENKHHVIVIESSTKTPHFNSIKHSLEYNTTLCKRAKYICQDAISTPTFGKTQTVYC